MINYITGCTYFSNASFTRAKACSISSSVSSEVKLNKHTVVCTNITEVNTFIYLPTGCFVKLSLDPSGLHTDDSSTVFIQILVGCFNQPSLKARVVCTP